MAQIQAFTTTLACVVAILWTMPGCGAETGAGTGDPPDTATSSKGAADIATNDAAPADAGTTSGGSDTSSAASDTGPVVQPDGTPCDDDDPCTIGDHLKAGKCTAGADLCQCRADTDCAVFEDGDSCNGTLVCEKAKAPYTCRTDAATIKTCDAAANTVCSTNACNPVTGECALLPEPKGKPCVDNDPCTPESACTGGKCVSSGATQCECKTDADCKSYDDGNACNGTLYCDTALFPNKCRVKPNTLIKCNVGDPTKPCTTDACDTATGKCAATPVEDIHDYCAKKAGACDEPLMIATASLKANHTTTCSDGDACTTGEKCLAGKCDATDKVGATDICKCKTNADCKSQEDGNNCNGTLYCDVAAEECKLNPNSLVTCPTASDTACVKNVCQPQTGLCALTPVAPGSACEDGDACTTNSYCKQGTCAGGTNTCTCTQDSDCTAKNDEDLCDGTLFCDKQAGVCVNNPATLVQCSLADNDACQKNVCIAKTGKCELHARAEVTLVCAKLLNGQDNPNECSWMLQPPNHAKAEDLNCNDGDQCTTGDACDKKTCKPGEKTCQCTTNADCLKEDDGNLCNGVPYCDKTSGKGVCKPNPASAVFCSSATDDTCGANTCDPKTGGCYRKATNDGKACTEAGKCQSDTTCKDKVCQGKPVDCDDNNACTADICDKEKGCVHSPKSCEDGNQCTKDSCDPKTGECSFAKQDLALCNADDSGCTINDVCVAGVCKAGKPAVCGQPTGACEKAVCLSSGATEFKCSTTLRAKDEPCAGGKHCKLASVCDGKGTCEAKGADRLTIGRFSKADWTITYRTVAATSSGYIVGGVALKKDGSAAEWVVQRVGADASKISAPIAIAPTTKYGTEAGVHGLVALPGGGFIAAGAVASGTLVGGKPNYDFTVLERPADDTAKDLWSTQYDDNQADPIIATGIAAHPHGGYVACGHGPADGAGSRGIIVRIAAQAGLKAWQWRSSAALARRALAITVEPEGTSYVAGDNIGAINTGWVQAVSSSGKDLWNTQLDIDVDLTGIVIDADDDLVVAGTWHNGAIDQLLIAGVRADTGELTDTYKTSVVAQVRALTIREDGGLLVAGALVTGGTSSQAWVSGYTARGEAQWTRTYDKSGAGAGFWGLANVEGDGFVAVGSVGDGLVLRADDWGNESCTKSGECAGKSLLGCDDANPCTTDLCTAAGGCDSKANKFVCEDGDQCTYDDKCVAGACKSGPVNACDDGNVCTKDSCNKQSGCVNQKQTGTPCPDDKLCTANEKCVAGACKVEPKDCDDNNPCTKDTCGETTDCENTALADETACGEHKVCLAKKCVRRFAVDVSVGGSHSCALGPDGGLSCWGYPLYTGQFDGTGSSNIQLVPDHTIPATVKALPPLKQVEATVAATYALSTTGVIYTWGYGDKGALGNGTNATSWTSQVIGPVKNATFIGANGQAAAAVDGTGKGFAWGGVAYGQGWPAPTATTGAWLQLAAASLNNQAFGHACGITTAKEVHCFGANYTGAVGVGNDPDPTKGEYQEPVKVPGIANAKAITVREQGACALLESGKVMCWGSNDNGEVGDGSTATAWTPKEVVLLSDVIDIDGGKDHTCAATKDGKAWCWGKSDHGQLGNGTKANKNAPTLVSGMPATARKISAGMWHSCAVVGDGSVYCWGSNHQAQLGSYSGKSDWHNVDYPTALQVRESGPK